jgi:YD repeat-containing protein
MRAVAVICSLISLVVSSQTAAAKPALRDAEIRRPDVRTVTVRYQEPGPRGALIDVGRERMVYSAEGRLIEHENQNQRGRVRVRFHYTYDTSGRLSESHYRDHTGRVEIRRYSYKLDAAGRISERDLRNPAAPPGELRRDVYTWHDDGSRTVRTYRHYAKEGPYPDGSSSFDAAGRPKTRCYSNHCELYEYDDHGEISRVREQNRQTHHYRVHENRYDAAGRLIHQRIGGSETTYHYNARGDVSEEQNQLAGKPTTHLTYQYEYR